MYFFFNFAVQNIYDERNCCRTLVGAAIFFTKLVKPCMLLARSEKKPTCRFAIHQSLLATKSETVIHINTREHKFKCTVGMQPNATTEKT